MEWTFLFALAFPTALIADKPLKVLAFGIGRVVVLRSWRPRVVDARWPFGLRFLAESSTYSIVKGDGHLGYRNRFQIERSFPQYSCLSSFITQGL